MELPGQRRSRHRLAGSGGADQQKLAAGQETVLAQAGLLALLAKHALQANPQAIRQDHVGQSQVWITCMQKTSEFTLRLSEGNRPRASRDPNIPALGRVDEVLEFLSKLTMALTRLVRSELHRGREETVSMTVESGPRLFAQKGPRFGDGEARGGERPIRRSWSGLHSLIGRGSLALRL